MYKNPLENEIFKLRKELRIAILNNHSFEIEILKDEIYEKEKLLEMLEG